MISFGKIPNAIQHANAVVCEYVEHILDISSADSMVDTARENAINRWANTLQIDTTGKNTEMLRTEIIARFNANGSVNVEWFYLLAERIGFAPARRATATFVPDNKNAVSVSWGVSDRNMIYITDGKFLPFRSGISMSGNIAYGNNTHGATSVCVIFMPFNDKRDEAMMNLLLLARNLGTIMLFYRNGVLL